VNSLTRRRRYIYLFNLILNEKAQNFIKQKIRFKWEMGQNNGTSRVTWYPPLGKEK
jgi:hypothetical protein